MSPLRILTLITCLLAAAVAPAAPEIDITLETRDQRVSYAIGYKLIDHLRSIEALGYNIDYRAVARGMLDATTNTQPLVDPVRLNVFAGEVAQKQDEKERLLAEARRRQGEINLAEAQKFLQANALRPGVVALPSGLQYKVLAQGAGRPARPDSVVQANYVGRFISGEEFDRSQPGAPFEFSLRGGVIDGWLEAFRLMREGDRWEIYVPPHLAYGEEGAPPTIPSHALLLFEVELVRLVP